MNIKIKGQPAAAGKVEHQVRPIPCYCGQEPDEFFISGSILKLLVIGCKNCRITSPARMNTVDAITEWNNFKRNDKDGNRLTPNAKLTGRGPEAKK